MKKNGAPKYSMPKAKRPELAPKTFGADGDEAGVGVGAAFGMSVPEPVRPKVQKRRKIPADSKSTKIKPEKNVDINMKEFGMFADAGKSYED